MITSSDVPGVRELRRIMGEYYMKEEDIFDGARFDDVVAYVTF